MANETIEYLKQIKELDISIEQKRQQLEKIQKKLISTQSLNSFIENIDVFKCIKCLNNKINIEISSCIAAKNHIISEIKRLDNKCYVSILYKTYVEYKTCEQIAKEIHYSPEYIKHIQTKARKEFYNKFLAK